MASTIITEQAQELQTEYKAALKDVADLEAAKTTWVKALNKAQKVGEEKDAQLVKNIEALTKSEAEAKRLQAIVDEQQVKLASFEIVLVEMDKQVEKVKRVAKDVMVAAEGSTVEKYKASKDHVLDVMGSFCAGYDELKKRVL